jgi:hypothetical protein
MTGRPAGADPSDTMPTPRTDAIDLECNSAAALERLCRQLERENTILRNGMKEILEGVFKPKMIATRVLYHLERMDEENK